MHVKIYVVLLPLMLFSAFAGGTLALVLQGNVSAQESGQPKHLTVSSLNLIDENGALYGMVTPQGIIVRTETIFEKTVTIRNSDPATSATVMTSEGIKTYSGDKRLIELGLYDSGQAGAGLKIFDEETDSQVGMLGSDLTRGFFATDRSGRMVTYLGVKEVNDSALASLDLGTHNAENRISLEVSPAASLSRVRVMSKHGDLGAVAESSAIGFVVRDKTRKPIWLAP